MKQISARQFRVSFPVLVEPVQVAQRRDGELVVLGTWTPLAADVARIKANDARLVGGLMAAAGFTPVPKPKPRATRGGTSPR